MRLKRIKEVIARAKKVKDKQFKYLWKKMQDIRIIKRAWRNLRKGKTKRKEVKEIEANFDEEVLRMRTMIAETTPEHPEKGYNPPKKRKSKIVKERGKKRVAHLADIHEQWYFHIIVCVLKPIVMRRLNDGVCGCIPGRGAHLGKDKIEDWISKGVRNIGKFDIRHFYDSTRILVVIKAFRRDIADNRFLYCIAKIYRYNPKGILIGLFISPWIANYLLCAVDEEIMLIPGVQMIRYVDDIVVAGSKKALHEVKKVISIELGKIRLKLKSNYQIFKFDYTKKDGTRIGRPLDFMGFVFFREKTVMRKSILLSATRLARKLRREKEKGRRYYLKMVRGIISLMGWFKHTATYDCYRKHIKPCLNIGKLKKIVSKKDKEARENDRLDYRKNVEETAGVRKDSTRALYAA